MKYVSLALSFAILAGISALAVRRFDDRELFVPPPDAVAEGFVREVVEERFLQARHFLTEPHRPTDALQQIHDTILQQVGEQPSEIEAEVISRDDDRALVSVRLSSHRGSESVSLGLLFDGQWKVELQ